MGLFSNFRNTAQNTSDYQPVPNPPTSPQEDKTTITIVTSTAFNDFNVFRYFFHEDNLKIVDVDKLIRMYITEDIQSIEVNQGDDSTGFRFRMDTQYFQYLTWQGAIPSNCSFESSNNGYDYIFISRQQAIIPYLKYQKDEMLMSSLSIKNILIYAFPSEIRYILSDIKSTLKIDSFRNKLHYQVIDTQSGNIALSCIERKILKIGRASCRERV